LTALYELSKKNTPPAVIEEIFTRAQKGEAISAADVKPAKIAAEIIPFRGRPVQPEPPDEPESKTLQLKPPDPPDIDDGTIEWIERALDTPMYNLCNFGGWQEEVLELLTKAHARLGDPGFFDWLTRQGAEIATNLTLEEAVILAADRKRRASRSPTRKAS